MERLEQLRQCLVGGEGGEDEGIAWLMALPVALVSGVGEVGAARVCGGPEMGGWDRG